jgi:hypothetical protein
MGRPLFPFFPPPSILDTSKYFDLLYRLSLPSQNNNYNLSIWDSTSLIRMLLSSIEMKLRVSSSSFPFPRHHSSSSTTTPIPPTVSLFYIPISDITSFTYHSFLAPPLSVSFNLITRKAQRILVPEQLRSPRRHLFPRIRNRMARCHCSSRVQQPNP